VPLKTLAIGLLVVVVDFKVNGYDLVPDPIGWAVFLSGLAGLPSSTRWRGWVTMLAALCLLGSIVAWFPQIRVEVSVGGVGPDGLAVGLLATAVMTGVTAVLCASLSDLAGRAGDASAAAKFRTACWLDVLTTVLLPLAWLLGDVGIVALVVAGLAVVIYIVVLLFTHAARPWAGAAGVRVE
jgi:hypothetical protein